jgi:TonB-dependent SusC/RagA subfamily outer membrane receptor
MTLPYVLNNQQLQHSSDLTNLVSGRVVDAKGKPTKAKIYLVNPAAGTQAFFKETKADGEFLFTNLTPQANYMLIAQPVAAKEKLSFEVSKAGMFQNPLADERLYKRSVADNMLAMATKRKQAFLAKTQTVEMPSAILAPVKSQSNLSEVVVVGYGSMKRKDLTGSVSFVSAKELQSGLNLSTALSGKVSGLMIQSSANSGASPFIRIRGSATLSSNNKPLLVVNGVPQENLDVNLQAENIENITVLKDATATALYGCRGTNGVIIVNEKRRSLTPLLSYKPKSKFSLATHYFFTAGTPFTVVRKYYAPVYEKTETDVRNDFRENIYWNPIVQTDDEGKATLQFYNNDVSTTFRIVAEGIGYNGLPGNAEKTYTSRAVIAAEIKIPHNVTVGDKPQLPLNVKNNGTRAAEFKVQVSTIKGISFSPFPDCIWLQPGEARELLLPAVALSKLQDSLRVTVIAAGGRQQLRVPIAVAEKGFPIHITKAGSSLAKHPFTISEVIPGSMHATFKIFSSLEGQLLDGIESMLKEPYGCFEQTSSTTYPNVFILKYLKESGKSNAAIEQKARKYITAGYKRLVGFETSEDGFEWFGHAPAHEALTAYGLLEFTDIQKFIEVDKKVMDRTLNFLLKKRDGKGGFGVRKGGYDRFASVPASVANTYIVYAIARSGHGKAIPTEYEQAYLNALKTKDAYQLALMALSAHYMGLNSHFQQLLLELDNCYERKNLSAVTSVVNSGGASLKVETRALYVQALLCQPQPNLAKAAILLNELMNEKSHYGYGSTQATVLALQAVVAFAKASSAYQKTQPTITATLNQQAITDAVLPRDGSNIFEVAFDKKQAICPGNTRWTISPIRHLLVTVQ